MRRRTVALRRHRSDKELCQLEHANRITSIAVTASIVGLAISCLVHAIA